MKSNTFTCNSDYISILSVYYVVILFLNKKNLIN